MLAVKVEQFTGPDGLCVAEVPMPTVEHDQLLIDVKASGVCFADLLTMKGRYQRKLAAPYLIGTELAGVVIQAPGQSRFAVGDRVLSIGQSGGFSEYCAVQPGWTVNLPDEVDFVEACALPNYQTIDFALAYRCIGMQPQRALVLGAGGGLGRAAVDILSLRGVEVVAATRNPKLSGLDELGAAEVVDSADPESFSRTEQFDLVIDPVGGETLPALMSLRPGGLYLTIGFAAGKVPEVRLNKLLLRNIAISGAAWGEYIMHDPEALEIVHAHTVNRVAQGWRPRVGTVYQGLESVPLAFQQLENGTHQGKQVVIHQGTSNYPTA